MKRLKDIVRFLFGENENYSLENRLFISALIIGMLLGIIGSATNFILLDSVIAIIIPILASLLLGGFYYFVRFKSVFKPLAFPIIVSAYIGLAFIWYFNGGMNGSNDFVFIVAFILGIIMVERKSKIYVFLLFITIKSILYFIQLYRPELIAQFPNENARWLDVYTTSLYTSFIIYLIINFLHRNYTQERLKVVKSKKELLATNLKLKESNETKDMLFSIISHDLRTPFSSILGFSKLLVQNTDNYDSEKIIRLARNINNTANETFLLLENLLKWSRLQNESIKPDFVKLNLYSIVEELYSIFSNLAINKKITINNEINPDIFVFCDEEMIKTVLRNLVINSIKFTEDEGLVEISATEFDKYIEVVVSDNGVGISADRIPELFNTLKINSTTGTGSEQGTGLGLHLCKALVEKQGGKIRVDSKSGEGSKFSFTVEKFGETVNMKTGILNN
jgi:signal transduction histidine kinase